MYDYIIVGAGSAGCVLADGLSANEKHRVLVIESGPVDRSLLIAMPRGIGKLLTPDNPHVWSYQVDRGAGQESENWLKGHTLGGSSSINGMVYARGFASDYDRWAENWGCDGWSWDHMLPHFLAHEDHQLGAAGDRGVGGPLHITGHPKDSGGPAAKQLCEAFLDASEAVGIARVADTNQASTGGIGYQPRNIWQGTRQSAAKAFLHPAMRRANLTVMVETQVLRIVFKDQRAIGVEVEDRSGRRIIHCNCEVILSAGAIESPKLLQLSGIGAAQRLSELGIAVIADVPSVGQNLREHLYVTNTYRVTKGSLNKAFQGIGLLKNITRYALNRSGPMANAAQEIIGYIKSRPELSRPDCQIGAGLYTVANSPKGPVLDSLPGLTIGGYHMHPQSSGELYITSNDPKEKPFIRANYLEHPEDQAATIAMLRVMRLIAQQAPLAAYIKQELGPGAELQSDEELLDACRSRGVTAYHVSGTCRMGGDSQSVVDPQTRVRGVSGLRVVDSSIFPELISGNTNAPTMAAARNAVGMILAVQ